MPCVKNVLSWLIFWGNNTHTHTLNICKAVSKKHEIVTEVISSNAAEAETEPPSVSLLIHTNDKELTTSQGSPFHGRKVVTTRKLC